jgi:hypothetical protein
MNSKRLISKRNGQNNGSNRIKNGNNGTRNGNGNTRAGRRNVTGGSTGVIVRKQTQNVFQQNFLGQTSIISGTDFVATVALPNTLSENSARLTDIGLSPSELSGTRWAQLASMYEKYRMINCSLCYVPAVSSVTGGQILGYWELDPDDVFGGSLGLAQDIRVGMAHQNSVLFNIYDNVNIILPLRTGIADFYVEKANSTVDRRWTQQGRFRLIATSTLSGFFDSAATTIPVGSIYLKWKCLFKNPQIQPSLAVPVQAGAQALAPAAALAARSFGAGTSQTWTNLSIEFKDGKDITRTANMLTDSNFVLPTTRVPYSDIVNIGELSTIGMKNKTTTRSGTLTDAFIIFRPPRENNGFADGDTQRITTRLITYCKAPVNGVFDVTCNLTVALFLLEDGMCGIRNTSDYTTGVQSDYILTTDPTTKAVNELVKLARSLQLPGFVVDFVAATPRIISVVSDLASGNYLGAGIEAVKFVSSFF